MRWSIFGRLFWKVWREDWKRWASVLAVGVVAIICSRYMPPQNAVSFDAMFAVPYRSITLLTLIYGFIIAVIEIGSARAQRDSVDPNVISPYHRLPSTLFISICSSISALTLSVCFYLIMKDIPSTTELLPYVVFVMVTTSIIGYAIGIWIHPWLSAVMLVPIVVNSIQNYSQHALNLPIPYPACTPINLVVAATLIYITSLTLSQKWHRRIPTIYQFVLAIAAISLMVAPNQSSNDSPDYDFGNDLTITTQDRSMEASQQSAGILHLKDYRTGFSFLLDTRQHISCDAVRPIGICRGKYVVALTYKKSNHTNSIICWNYQNNSIHKVIGFQDNQLYYGLGNETSAFMDNRHVYALSNDGKYIVVRLKTKSGKGLDYWVLSIPEGTMKMITANANPGYEIEVISSNTAIFVNPYDRTTRVLKLNTASLGPVIEWTGDLK